VDDGDRVGTGPVSGGISVRESCVLKDPASGFFWVLLLVAGGEGAAPDSLGISVLLSRRRKNSGFKVFPVLVADGDGETPLIGTGSGSLTMMGLGEGVSSTCLGQPDN
jgi:hypothetical protein